MTLVTSCPSGLNLGPAITLSRKPTLISSAPHFQPDTTVAIERTTTKPATSRAEISSTGFGKPVSGIGAKVAVDRPLRSAMRRLPAMAKQRQVRIEQRGALAAMQALERKTDEELEAETKYRSAAYAILGARAAERYDAESARAWFQKAMVSARPQERLALKRMADASLALAERRADDLKAAAEKLGAEVPSGRQLFLLRMMGVIAPPKSAPLWRRIAGPLVIVGIVIALLAVGLAIVELIALATGPVTLGAGLLYSLLLVSAVLGVLVVVGRRRQKAALAARR